MTPTLAAPFPYFGGKRVVASEVWRRFGPDIRHYIEPFCGSAAVLLARPDPVRGYETINDADCMVANFWRATAAAPEDVQTWCDWPTNEADLRARHHWLLESEPAAAFRERMKTDPDHYDAKIAGWWVWGLCQWFGRDWCKSESKTRPSISSVVGVMKRMDWAAEFRALRDRLRHVRVCCGDWRRVCNTDATITGQGTAAVFLDPPYSDAAGRDPNIYRIDCLDVAHEVRAWCHEFGGHPAIRVALCGYDGEHNDLEAAGWRVYEWKAGGGMAHISKDKDSQGKSNAHRERIWFSPACVPPGSTLFDL